MDENLQVDFASEKIVKLKEIVTFSGDCTQAVQDCHRVAGPLLQLVQQSHTFALCCPYRNLCDRS